MLKGKSAVITGAGSGIGRASALLLAANGASIVCGDINEASANETVNLIRRGGGGGDAVAVKCDVAVAAQVESVVDLCCKKFGKIDIMFANAGISGITRKVPHFTEIDEANFLHVLKINLLGVFYSIKYAVLAMEKYGSAQGASIICTASVAGFSGFEGGSIPYCTSKAGVINMVKATAWELARRGIRINALCPGWIQTPMNQPLFDYAAKQNVKLRQLEYIPMERAAQPEELAKTVLHLASDASSYTTGQAIAVDGGVSTQMPQMKRPLPKL